MRSHVTIHYNHEAFTPEQNQLIAKAMARATKAHLGQKRKSGEPFVIHPVAVAETVAEWGFDGETIAAALLHDTVEDTLVTLEEVEVEFGQSVMALVDGVTKLTVIESMPGPQADSARLEASNENLRKLLLATAKDFRVIIIKLADRLHNLRTLNFQRPERRPQIARESLDVFAPLADRLGMGQLKCEIEDLSFRYWKPDEFAALSAQVAVTAKKSQRYLAVLKRAIGEDLRSAGVEPLSIEGRQKHLYSVYKKMIKVDGDIDKIYDLIAVRIIVPDVAACYQTLGILHQHYRPLIYRIKDYIAVPKPNGYQSLHTTVFAEDGRITEIQIRTPQMHEEAEHGLSAHFYYDAQKGSKAYAGGGNTMAVPDKLRWVGDLAELQATVGSGQEFVEGASLELFSDRIFVFSPRGDLYDLPEGATPVDFAFTVHSNLGLRMLGARVNGRMATLDTKLENRDVVEVLTKREPAPNRDWLNFVRTPSAKNRIRAWFRAESRDANITSGKTALESGLRVWGHSRLEDLPKAQVAEALDSLHLRDADELYAALGDGSLGLVAAIRRLVPDAARPSAVPVIKRPQATGRVVFDAGEDLPFNLAACCHPIFPQPIMGYVTRGSGITVHVFNCPNVPAEQERFVKARWETQTDDTERLVCRLEISAYNRVGLLTDVTGIVARGRFNISNVSSSDEDDGIRSRIAFSVEVPDLFALARVMRDLERIPGIQAIERV